MTQPHDNTDPDARSSRQHDGTFRLAPIDTPKASYTSVDRVSELFDQLAGLVTQSLASVDKARKALGGQGIVSHALISAAERHLLSAAGDLDRMSELVHAGLQSKGQALGSPHLARTRPVTIAEAVRHAVDVCKPLAERHGVELSVDVSAQLGEYPAGAIYTVALNAVQNAIEAVAKRGGNGRVEVELRPESAPKLAYGRDDRAWALLEVRDDGVGLPVGTESSRVFDLGYSTKKQGAGVGLAVSRSVIQGMGGTIELAPRMVVRSIGQQAGHQNAACRGCALRARFPVASMPTRRMSA